MHRALRSGSEREELLRGELIQRLQPRDLRLSQKHGASGAEGRPGRAPRFVQVLRRVERDPVVEPFQRRSRHPSRRELGQPRVGECSVDGRGRQGEEEAISSEGEASEQHQARRRHAAPLGREVPRPRRGRTQIDAARRICRQPQPGAVRSGPPRHDAERPLFDQGARRDRLPFAAGLRAVGAQPGHDARVSRNDRAVRRDELAGLHEDLLAGAELVRGAVLGDVAAEATGLQVQAVDEGASPAVDGLREALHQAGDHRAGDDHGASDRQRRGSVRVSPQVRGGGDHGGEYRAQEQRHAIQLPGIPRAQQRLGHEHARPRAEDGEAARLRRCRGAREGEGDAEGSAHRGDAEQEQIL